MPRVRTSLVRRLAAEILLHVRPSKVPVGESSSQWTTEWYGTTDSSRANMLLEGVLVLDLVWTCVVEQGSGAKFEHHQPRNFIPHTFSPKEKSSKKLPTTIQSHHPRILDYNHMNLCPPPALSHRWVLDEHDEVQVSSHKPFWKAVPPWWASEPSAPGFCRSPHGGSPMVGKTPNRSVFGMGNSMCYI